MTGKYFGKIKIYFFFFLLFILSISSSVEAIASVSFISTFPQRFLTPPSIVSVTNASSLTPANKLKIYAVIEGKIQTIRCCKEICESHPQEFSSVLSTCSATEISGSTDFSIVPNPTCIPGKGQENTAYPDVCNKPSGGNPKIYYYFNSNAASVQSIDMTFNSVAERFEAEIDYGSHSQSDELTYYIIAADSLGNVAVQVPDTARIPAENESTWNTNYQTPAADNCAGAVGHYDCGRFATGSISCFSSNFTVNDPQNDTCNSNGDPDQPEKNWDILGFSAGVGAGFSGSPDANYLTVRFRLSGEFPNNITSYNPALELFIFNTDVPDANPSDLHLTNSFILTYAPYNGAEGFHPAILWDGNCVTTPGAADPMNCILLQGGVPGDQIKAVLEGTNLTLIIPNILPNLKRLTGSQTQSTVLTAFTTGFDITGNAPIWISDAAPALRIYKKNQKISGLTSQLAPAPPNVGSPATCKNSSGAEFSGTCPSRLQEPSSFNICKFTINPSPDYSITGAYKIYHSIVDDATVAMATSPIAFITENLDKTLTADFTVSPAGGLELDGRTHYFFITAQNAQHLLDKAYETKSENASKTFCTVEDLSPPPLPPASLLCSTPSGYEKSCKCVWTSDTLADPSIKGFYVYRNSVLQNLNPIPAAVGLNEYFYLDESENLIPGSQYSYSVTAVDAGGSVSAIAAATCIPADFKPPEKVRPSIILKPRQFGTDVYWNANIEEDMKAGGSYNVLKCKSKTYDGSDCIGQQSFSQIGNSILHPDAGGILTVSDLDFQSGDTYTCYWVQACDNCISKNSCPGASAPNCSGIDSISPYRVCLMVTNVPDSYSPGFPDSATATPSPMGSRCDLEWSQVCQDESGLFGNCNWPSPSELTGYKIIRVPATGDDCSTTTIPDPSTGQPVGMVAFNTRSFTDSNLENGIKYCYRIFGFDSSNNFSRTVPPPVPTACTPVDKTSPSSPSILNISFTTNSCSPNWSAALDSDTNTFTVHRCSGKPAGCSAASSFAIPPDGESLAVTITNFTDPGLTSGEDYTYCITAKDKSANTSDIVGPGGAISSSNCGQCRPAERPQPPTSVEAGETVDKLGFNAWWQASADDASAGTYRIYACRDKDVDLHNCRGPIGQDVPSSEKHKRSDANPALFIQDAGVFINAYYYIAVTYVGAGGVQSLPEFSRIMITIDTNNPVDPCNTDPSKCTVTIRVAGRFQKYGISTCQYDSVNPADCPSGAYKKDKTPQTQVILEVIDLETNTVIKTKTPDDEGTVGDILLNPSELKNNGRYTLRAKYPAKSYDSAFGYRCSNSTIANPINPDVTDCIVNLLDTTDLKSAAMFNAAGIEAPDAASGGYGGEIGNFNGDNKINITDLGYLRPAFGTKRGDTCYRAWADLNLDGKITIVDIGLLKLYFGTLIPTDPNMAPKITNKTDPLPACCFNKSCN